MRFTTSATELQLQLEGKEQFFALKAGLHINKKDIVAIEWFEIFQDWRKWEVRLPGTGAPRALMAGSFWTEEGWDFLYLKKPHGLIKPFVHNVLKIETTLHRYRRILVTLDKQEAQRIIDWYHLKKK